MTINIAEEYFNQRVKEEVDRIVSATSTSYKDELVQLYTHISHTTDNARELFEDFKEQGLSVNAIEAEGGYRALLTLKNQIWAYHLPKDVLEKLKQIGYEDGNQ